MSFQHIITQPLPYLNAEGRHYRHKATGCDLFHLHCADRENLFSFVFRTPPADDTGISHILEHTVLCGSRNFPVKDPFAKMIKSSMNTFLNAMTSTDRTFYPASSAVPADFFHLMEVYADAVFFPLLKSELFHQEAFHWEFLPQPHIQGVVYNEMKGEYSSRDAIAATQNYRSLFSQGPYSRDFGGDPSAIPTLSHAQLLQFHQQYYHPSNALIFLYGNIPTEESMNFLEKKFLHHFSSASVPTLTQATPRIDHPVKITVPFPITGEISRQASTSLNWLLFPSTNFNDALMSYVIDDLLLGNSAAPLYIALTESGLGQGISASGISNDCHELIFSAGLDGTDKHNTGNIEEVIEKTLKKVVAEGFPSKFTEAVFRRMETRLREQISGASNGLRQLRRIARAWAYEADLLESLKVTEQFIRFREKHNDNPAILSQWIDQWLLQNSHRSTVTVYPDPNMESRLQKQTESWIKDQLKKPDEEERLHSISEHFSQMQNIPEREEDLAKIPRLHRNDIPSEAHRIPHEKMTLLQDVPLILQTLPTNDLVYLRLAFDLGPMSHEQLIALPLLRAAFTECGIRGLSHDELAVEIDYHTAGIGADLSAEATLEGGGSTFRPLFIVYTKFLRSRTENALSLLFRILTSLDFSHALPRLTEVIKEQHSGVASSATANGHIHAIYHATRGLSASGACSHTWYSFPQLDYLSQSIKNMANTAKSLERLSEYLIDQSRCSVAVSCEEQVSHEIRQLLKKHLQSLPRKGCRHETGVPFDLDTSLPQKEALVFSSLVAYNAMAFPAFRLGTKEFSAQLSLAQLLSTDYLWEHVRMRNGAYGAFAIPKGKDGIMILASYRDPHIRNTLQIFESSLAHFSSAPCQKEDINATLFSILGKELRTLSPEDKTDAQFHRFLHGITDELRQTQHGFLLDLEPADIQKVASHLKDSLTEARTASLSGEILLNNPDELVKDMVHRRYDLTL